MCLYRRELTHEGKHKYMDLSNARINTKSVFKASDLKKTYQLKLQNQTLKVSRLLTQVVQVLFTIQAGTVRTADLGSVMNDSSD